MGVVLVLSLGRVINGGSRWRSTTPAAYILAGVVLTALRDPVRQQLGHTMAEIARRLLLAAALAMFLLAITN